MRGGKRVTYYFYLQNKVNLCPPPELAKAQGCCGPPASSATLGGNSKVSFPRESTSLAKHLTSPLERRRMTAATLPLLVLSSSRRLSNVRTVLLRRTAVSRDSVSLHMFPSP